MAIIEYTVQPEVLAEYAGLSPAAALAKVQDDLVRGRISRGQALAILDFPDLGEVAEEQARELAHIRSAENVRFEPKPPSARHLAPMRIPIRGETAAEIRASLEQVGHGGRPGTMVITSIDRAGPALTCSQKKEAVAPESDDICTSADLRDLTSPELQVGDRVEFMGEEAGRLIGTVAGISKGLGITSYGVRWDDGCARLPVTREELFCLRLDVMSDHRPAYATDDRYRANALADECQRLADENQDLHARCSRLEREIERLQPRGRRKP